MIEPAAVDRGAAADHLARRFDPRRWMPADAEAPCLRFEARRALTLRSRPGPDDLRAGGRGRSSASGSSFSS